MENALFDNFDMLEQVPTDLMTEITVKPTDNGKSILTDIAGHTEDKSIFTSQPEQTPNFGSLNNPQQQPQTQAQRMNAGSLITGDMAVGFLDMALPVLFVLLIEKFNGKKVNKRLLQATSDEKKTIAPVLQNYLNSINFNVDSPLNALLLTVAFIYGTKAVEVLNMPEAVQGVKMPSAFAPQQQQQSKGRNADGSIKKDGRGRPRKN